MRAGFRRALDLPKSITSVAVRLEAGENVKVCGTIAFRRREVDGRIVAVLDLDLRGGSRLLDHDLTPAVAGGCRQP
jgi:hypothetical protein